MKLAYQKYKISFVKILIIILLCIYSIIIYAEVYIDITTGINNSYPISILPFYSEGDNVLNIDNISNIIISDLKNTGKFHVLPYSELPEHPKNISDISINKWLNLGLNNIVIGKINKINNDQYIIFYQLVDLSNKKVTIILQNQYTVVNQWIRYVVHSISNDIFEKLTNIKGIFCTKIAYIIYIDHEEYPYKLFISDYDGYNKVLLYHSKKPLMSPTWAPSSNQLVYVIFTRDHSILVIHNLKNGVIQRLTNFPRHNGAPSFSPDGKKLAFALSKSGSLNLYVMNLNSNEIQQITNERSNNTEPSWFPDNKTLLYTSDRSGTPQIYKISTVNTINNIPERLSWSNHQNQNGIVSSDGKFIIMISKNNTSQNVTKLDLLTGKFQKLTNNILDETFTLSPNDNMVIYSTLEGLQSKLYLLSINNHSKIHLPIYYNQIRFLAWSSYIE